MQSGDTRGTTRLAREDQFHSRGTALKQCAREAQVLEDNSRVFLEYSKTTREFYSSTRRQHALFCKLWRDRYRTWAIKISPRKIFEFGYFTLTSAMECDKSSHVVRSWRIWRTIQGRKNLQ